MKLKVQVFLDGLWQDAVSLTFAQPDRLTESLCISGYEPHYLAEHYERLDSPFAVSVSAAQRLSWTARRDTGLPAFVYDLLPAGAARRWLERRFGHERPADWDLDLFLLARCTPAPVGHLRIESSVLPQTSPSQAFSRSDVVARADDFLEYAYEQGAAMGGATGAGGEAPKLLLTEDAQGGLHADAALADARAHRHWLVKFARGEATARDRDILRSEYHYYRAVNALGLNTIDPRGLALEEGDKPSLWLPRFDRKVRAGGVERIALESIYSLCGNTRPGSHLIHEEVVTRLVDLWDLAGQGNEVEELVFEYVRRDLLNRILGNSDNHGRNLSILRHGNRLELAPIYDLAPMVLDPEGISRSTKWREEQAGSPPWRDLCRHLELLLATRAGQGAKATEGLFERVRQQAREFLALPDLLTALPDDVRRQEQRLPVLRLEQRLQEWGLW
ncbi:type II toxin-antitoxin system HipA family toxin [Pseudomonas rhizoryzae]|uniref:type II toxin-antitoxin system HipA family toxin n=1 Tax=Pseudomonas rhizoryzae TaxID=2571129 RepID=UPI0007375052|nr:HipA domain-containing protein [Pseudomonas rhizoryzae]KTT27823.1 toxin HipA [Pseudomonas psychrotolerans]KTT35965.1 toxin HipA [Pseudomonas psychrotolerans]KTT76209.1 toxin HipA [Pseudomonas psychrotolerans]